MEHALVSVPAAPVRKKPRHDSEMVNQLLFGESVRILRVKRDGWVCVSSRHDGYEGWMTRSLLEATDEPEAGFSFPFVSKDLLSQLSMGESRMYIPAGATLPHFKNGEGSVGDMQYRLEGAFLERDAAKASADLLIAQTLPWLNAPYLWGGRSPLGVDCSGLVQVQFKMLGIDLPRDAWQQAMLGSPVEKLSAGRAGDLAFFSKPKETKIVHVGILLGDADMIHASGRVRVDRIYEDRPLAALHSNRLLELQQIRRLL